MRVEKHNSVAGGKTWQVGEVIHSIEPQAKASSFSDLQLFHRVSNVADALKVAVRKYSVVENQQTRALKGRESVGRQRFRGMLPLVDAHTQHSRASIISVLDEFFQHGYTGRIKRKNFTNSNSEVDFLAARENGRQKKGY